MKQLLFALLGAAAAAAQAADITSVEVRQQWPWSTDVKVTYVVSNNEGTFDLQVEAYDGATRLDSSRLEKSMAGERYAISGNGAKSFFIDPVKAFGKESISIADFKVKLTAVATPSSRTEALYRIYDLDAGTCKDLSPAEIMNHPETYGDYETDYAKIGEGYNTTLTNVFVWTGVTNNTAYKTSKLVVRKIHAKDVVWQCGSSTTPSGVNVLNHDLGWVKLTSNYYIGVFPVTQAQYAKIVASIVTAQIPAYPSSFKNRDDSDYRPVEQVPLMGLYTSICETPASQSYSTTRGYVNNNENVYWPTNSYLREVSKKRTLGLMREKFNVEFDLPTEAQWEFACRAGTSGGLYNGLSATDAHAEEIAWVPAISGNETHPVGLKKPNAFGLYDILGNVFEYTRNRAVSGCKVVSGAVSGTGASQNDPAVDPVGLVASSGTVISVLRGGCWYSSYSRSHAQSFVRVASYSADMAKDIIGFRVVTPEGAQWSPH